MSLKIWLDGQLVAKEDAKISVYDHGLLYGDGVFEGIRVYNGRIFEFAAHLRRLFESAKSIRLDIPYTAEELTEATHATIAANSFKDCYIRMVVTRGRGALGIDPTTCERPSVFIITDLIRIYPPELYARGMAVITSSIIRNHPNALSPKIKSLNYLNNILAKIEAVDAGVLEAIMFNHMGFVAECTADNFFLVRSGIVYTPSASDGSLEGVTANCIRKLAAELGVPLQERHIDRHDLYIADECFLTGTGAEVMPVTAIDKRTIGAGAPGPITRRLIDAFHKHVRGERCEG
ncbi:MAG TPA: branched-chain-amino-acid transaminase [Tepidisphaeraceae bacterium]|jgi:branched-chain amino acid aminotransferase